MAKLTTGLGLTTRNCGGSLRTLAGAQGLTTTAARDASMETATLGNGRGCMELDIGFGIGTGWGIGTTAGRGGGGGGGGLARDGAATGVAVTGRVATGTSALCNIDNTALACTIPELELALEDFPPPLPSTFRGKY